MSSRANVAEHGAPSGKVAVADALDGAARLLGANFAVVARGVVPEGSCTRWARGVLSARHAWTVDFGGDQYCLGRAFYVHLETGRSTDYFDDAVCSNARVERHAPGLQDALRSMMARAVRGRVVARPGWCGAGVHVFPRGQRVARLGGVVHFDTEGLATGHVAAGKRALSLVAMLQPATRGGGLRFWPHRHCSEDRMSVEARRVAGMVRLDLGAGDVVVFDSYRLHQIEPFGGSRHRLSAALHAAELHAGVWESWF